jgi:uncharacterized protein YdcH (DUF465 family)
MNELAAVDLDGLKAKHHELDADIRKEEQRQIPDEGRVATLKKAKLQLKDRIALLEKKAA